MSQPTWPSGRVSFRALLDVAASVAMITAAGVLVWASIGGAGARPPAIPTPVEPLLFDGAASLGRDDAPAVLVAFSDFECPFCSRFATEILPALKSTYIDTGRVQLLFRHLPLPKHANAIAAAIGADCARRQNLFWPFHDRLFSAPSRLTADDIRNQAIAIGVDAETFDACRLDEAARGQVSADAALAQRLQITGTPAFVVGGRSSMGTIEAVDTIAGARPLPDFARVIDRVLRTGT